MTTREQAQATLAEAEIKRLESRGVVASRTLAGDIRRGVLSALNRHAKIDVWPLVRDRMSGILADAMVAGHVTGIRRSMLMQPKVTKELELGVFDTVIGLIKKKLGLDPDKLNKQYKTQAFKILKDASDEINYKLNETVNALIEDGVPTKKAMSLLGEKFEKLGITPKNDFQLETIFRTQTQLAYSAGRWQADHDPDIEEILWGYKYVATGDDRTRPTHEALDGTTLPKDDPFWNRFFPPNGWNCRCQAISIYEKRAVVKAPKTLDDGTKVEPDKGFAFNPGKVLGSIALSHHVLDLGDGIHMSVGTSTLRRLLAGGSISLDDVRKISSPSLPPDDLRLALEKKGVFIALSYDTLALEYSDDQPRGADGKWIDGAGGFSVMKTGGSTKQVKIVKQNKNGTFNVMGPKGKIFKNVKPAKLGHKPASNHKVHPEAKSAQKVGKLGKSSGSADGTASLQGKVKSGILAKMNAINDFQGDTVKVPLAASDAELKAIKKAFPGKTIERVNASKLMKTASKPTPKPEAAKAAKAAKVETKVETKVDPKVNTEIKKGGKLPKKVETGSVSEAAQAKWADSLDDNEASAVMNWSDKAYKGIRKAEASGVPNALAKDLYSALDKAPKYSGTVYRGLSLDSGKVLEQLTTPGAVVDFKATSSATASSGVAVDFTGGEFAPYGKKGVVLKIKTKSGVAMSQLSYHKNEKEVILRKDTKYRVTSVTKGVIGTGVKFKTAPLSYVVEMEEI